MTSTTNTTATDLRSLRFGVEMEWTGITRQDATKAIARALGVPAPTGWQTTVTDSQGRKWNAVYDASVYNGCEVVTPPLTYADIETLQEVIRECRRAGAREHSSCGIHIHIEAAPFVGTAPGNVRGSASANKLVNLVRLFSRYEDLVLTPILATGNRMATWCKPVAPALRSGAANRTIKTMRDLNRAWYGRERASVSHYDSSRYRALNLHNLWYRSGDARTVEFRCFNSTTHAGKVKAYVQFCLAIAAKALNANRVSAKKVEFDAGWTKYHIFGFLKYLGLKGEEFKTCRKHLMALGTGVAAFRNAADYSKWQAAQGRGATPAPTPVEGSPVAVSPAA